MQIDVPFCLLFTDLFLGEHPLPRRNLGGQATVASRTQQFSLSSSVPHVRYAASMPQMASPTVTSMLANRMSSSRGKDQILVSKRRNKEDAPNDRPCSSHEHIDEPKKMDRIPSSPSQRRQDPHWYNLRKHCGERNAYSSHSHAVLDFLKNWNEWAQLVDCGPMTNAIRKRHKLDAEPSMAELGEKCRTLKEVEGKRVESHQEAYPKGKRKRESLDNWHCKEGRHKRCQEEKEGR
ncbi:hypothetical protein HHK36_029257 [Tetracentron sinense]|uniref:DUF7648 domain-containing protein n=1 Tax=Tetracentron sinense TaxID=13715 RepID=A0A834YCQ6_TETSI|nr:hypothetical protein HHK36_029257 [Tetracentron sinense]